MFFLLYISKREYGGSYIQQQYNEHGYSVGYHGVYGSADYTIEAKDGKPGTEGYGSGKAISPQGWVEGCIQSNDGDEALLKLILDMHSTYQPTTFVIVVADAYLVKVTQQWMPMWNKEAIKGNHQRLHQDTLWLQVRDLSAQFITHLQADLGDDLADSYSVSLKPWTYKAPNQTHINKPSNLSPLLWTTMRLHTPFKHEPNLHYLVNTKDMYEIGNMSPSTVYGLVYTHKPSTMINNIVEFIDYNCINMATSILRLKNIATTATGAVLARHGVSVLSKPNRYVDSYYLGLDVPITEEITPTHKLYNSAIIFNSFERLLSKLKGIQGSFAMESNAVRMLDITEQLIVDKKPIPVLLTSPLSIQLQLGSGKKTTVATDTELPPLNTIRAVAKDQGRIYVGHLNVDGIYRYFYCLQTSDGIGLYSPWITKLQYV